MAGDWTPTMVIWIHRWEENPITTNDMERIFLLTHVTEETDMPIEGTQPRPQNETLVGRVPVSYLLRLKHQSR